MGTDVLKLVKYQNCFTYFGAGGLLIHHVSMLLPKDMPVGEDATSVEAHVTMLQSEYKKTQPDILGVKDRMVRTFYWRRREIIEGMPVEDVLQKYPFLKTSGVSIVNT